MKYRSEIDGLRAVAILPVVLFHAGFDLFRGGFVGVDVFFVISGYLITTIILSECHNGAFSLVGFYERRARRILPALFFVMLTCLPFAWMWMFVGQLKDFAQSLIAVTAFASNILFWFETSYFAGEAEFKPLLHTWSLAVEEQFYLLFPLFILLTWNLGLRRITYLLLGITGVSLLLSYWITTTAPNAAFYLLPTRLWELLIGTLVAFHLYRRGERGDQRGDELTSAFGLLLILYAVFAFEKTTPFPSLYALVPTLGTAFIILYSGAHTVTGRLLSQRYLVGLGLISYSTYLWHQPLFAFARTRSVDPPSWPIALTLGGLSLGLAYLTWRFIEVPFRDKTRLSRLQIFGTAACFCLGFSAIGVAGHVTDGFYAVTEDDPGALRSLSHRVRTNFGLGPACTSGFTESPLCRSADHPEIVVWGDSFAMHLVPGIIASNPKASVVQMTLSSCGPFIDLAPVTSNHSTKQARSCLEFNRKVIAWAEDSQSLKYAVLASPFHNYLDPKTKLVTADGVHPHSPALVLQRFLSTLEALSKAGIKPVVFAPPPSDGTNIGRCLVKSTYYGYDLNRCNVPLAKSNLAEPPLAKLFAQVQEKYQVVRISEVLCNHTICRTHIDGTFIHRDAAHLSLEGSAHLGRTMGFYERIVGKP